MSGSSFISRHVLLLFAVALFFVLLLAETNATAIHEKMYQETECKDHSHFNCHHIVSAGNCEGHADNGEVIGDIFCPVSCGRCEVNDTSIRTDQSCYKFGKQEITTHFFNSDPEMGDWIGVYAVTEDADESATPVAWYWTCGNKRDKCRTSKGSVTFPWLPAGKYRVLMARHGGTSGFKGPLNSFAESEPFEVVRGNSCAARRTEELDASSSSSSPREGQRRNLRGS
jgi:hypothetical protein